MKIRYLGHSAFHMEMNGFKIICDPFISPNPKASHIDVNELNADFILLTHGHEDHVADVESLVFKNESVQIISSFEIVSWYGQKGIGGHPMNLGGKKEFPFGTLKYVQAVHSSVLPDGTYGGNPGGFVIWNNEICFYFAGDTALTLDMQLIPRFCPKLDFAIFPIGDNFTMGYEDAVIASDFIQCDKIVACHFDTFGYIEIDHDSARKAFSDAGKKLIIMEIGQSLDIK